MRSLGLTAYRAMARRGDPASFVPVHPRPEGELIWLHAAETGNLLPLQDLARRLQMNRPKVQILMTIGDAAQSLPPSPGKDVTYTALPDEHPTAVEAFVAYWQPDLCLWAWGGLRPNLILETAKQTCPMILIDADSAGFDGRRKRWLPDVARKLLPLFQNVLARNESSAKRLRQLGAQSDHIETLSPLLAGGLALPCEDEDLADFSATIVGRAIWFANGVEKEELQTILAAHRQALRRSHRMMLLLRPGRSSTATEMAEVCQDSGFRVSNWSDGTFPNEATQVLLTEDRRDVGLFCRVAPVTFLGGSLVPGYQGPDPFDAAALGSAILYGPKVGHFLPFYSRLASAGAARIVNDADALATAVSLLIAPDQAASMAHAGWDVISEGAAATDRIVELALDTLDQMQAPA